MNIILVQSFKVFFFLFCISLLTSMAGLSGTSAALGLTVIALVAASKPTNFSDALKSLNFDGLKFVAFFVLAVGLSIIFNDFDLPHSLKILNQVRWALVLIALIYLFKNHLTFNFYEKCLDVMVALSFAVTFYALWQHLTGGDIFRLSSLDKFGSQFRSRGSFGIALTFSYVLGSFGLFLTFLSYFQEKKRFYYILGAVSCFACVYFSGSRGAWISLSVTLLSFFFLINKKAFLRCTAGFIILFLILLLNPSFQKRINTLSSVESSGSNRSRVALWTAYGEMYKDNPIFGVGYEQNVPLLPQYYAKLGIKKELIGHAHNDYLQVLVGTGIIGFASYILMIGFFLRKTCQLIKANKENLYYKGLAVGILAVQVYLYLGGLTQVNFSDSVVKYSLLYYWATLYLVEKYNKTPGLKNG